MAGLFAVTPWKLRFRATGRLSWKTPISTPSKLLRATASVRNGSRRSTVPLWMTVIGKWRAARGLLKSCLGSCVIVTVVPSGASGLRGLRMTSALAFPAKCSGPISAHQVVRSPAGRDWMVIR